MHFHVSMETVAVEIIVEIQIFTFWSTDIENFDKLADVFTFQSKHSIMPRIDS